MKLVVFGGSGMIGRRIVQEALGRGHAVTTVVRDPSRVDLADAQLTVVAGDVLDAASVATIAQGQDAVVSAVSPSDDPQMLVAAARALVDGVTQAGVRRLVVVGGAGSLEVAPGMQLVDSPGFPEAWKGVALGHRDALNVYRSADLDWTFVGPAALIEPGERTGRYRTSAGQLLADEQGVSRISAEDYAIALLDELETPHFARQVMGVGY